MGLRQWLESVRSAGRVPPEVPQIVGGQAGRVLAYGELVVPGCYAVATEHVLAWSQPADDGTVRATSVAWDQVLRASWSEEFLDLVLGEPAAIELGRNQRLRFTEPGRVPEVVRERINWTVLTSQHVKLSEAGSRSVLLTARRATRDGSVRWSAAFDPQGGPVTPEQAAAANRAIEALATQLGIG